MTAAALDFNISSDLLTDIRRWRTRAMVVGVIGVILLVLGWVTSPAQFYRSYLWAYIYFLGIAAGSMAWLMLQYLTGGAWGVAIRRPAEAAARTIPVMAVLFVPIAIGYASLYPWAHSDLVAADPILKHKAAYLNFPFFLVRAVAILGGWSLLSVLLNRWSLREDREGPRPAHNLMARLSGPGLIFWVFAVTFMSIDWVMSLNPDWFSTMFGLLFVAGQGLSSIAFLITILVLLSQQRPLSEILTTRHLHDVGKLMFANVMLWAYFSFSQWLIIWAGNLPEEIPWYAERLRGGWQYVALVLVFGHFALPFALLLSRDLKRNFKLLRRIAVFVLAMRVVDVYWFVIPDATRGAALSPSWIDVGAFLGIGGIWAMLFLGQLAKRPLIPANDIHIIEALEHGR
ncbi:MAG: hypothetical protein JO323_03250 [Acidobacteriia bacterium]|nr:hypothetical protein [Terriglobia bacterium]